MNESSARRPVVGVVGYLLDAEAAERRQFGRRDLNVYALNYFRKALDQGMLPVGLPPVEPEAAAAYCDLVEGLVLTGGSDVDPRFYGDEFELALTREALRRGLPVLGICRGMQILNVAMAGALEQDLARGDGIAHGTGSPRAAYHEIVVTDAELERRTGPRPRVNSLHHQAVSRVAPGLAVAGQADDGVIEAVVGEACPVLGVQWHPEQLPSDDPAGDGPFAWLRDRMAGR
jgi:putative glutamine amidotransferase